MFRKKFLLGLLVLVFCNVSAFPQGAVELTWKVLNYDINVTLPQNFQFDRELNSVANLRIKNISDTSYSRITLRISDKATISSVTVGGKTADFRESREDIGGNRYLNRIAITIPTVIPGGETEVRVTYKLMVESNSGLNSLSPINSQFLPLSFWYPTPTNWLYSGGADSAPIQLKISGAGDRTIVSAGENTQAGFSNRLFGQPFFVTGKWQEISEGGVTVYAPESSAAIVKTRASDVAKFVSEARSFVEAQFGKPISAPFRVVAVQRGAGFSNSGVAFVDESVFQREKLGAQTAMELAESVAKAWLDNQVEVSGPGFAVITEGLSRHVANKFIEQKFGEQVAETQRLRQRINYAAIAARDSPLTVTTPRDGYFYSSAANKGAMIWKYLERELGSQLFSAIKTNAADGKLDLAELRKEFAAQKEYLDFMLDNTTSMNLMIGVPQARSGGWVSALRNVGAATIDVDVVGETQSGKRLRLKARVPANGFGEVKFETNEKLSRVEVDPEAVFPQTNYTDDVSPANVESNDPILLVKREFDRQRYDLAEASAQGVLKRYPGLDEVRIFLARSQLAQNKLEEAQANFQKSLDSPLPLAQSLGWGNLGLGEIEAKNNQRTSALRHFNSAIAADAEYGVTFAARGERQNLAIASTIDPSIVNFFAAFDAAVKSANKANVEALVVPGEIRRFANSIAVQASNWKTTVVTSDLINDEEADVETLLNIKVINKEPETISAVFRISKVNGRWLLSGNEVFEARYVGTGNSK